MGLFGAIADDVTKNGISVSEMKTFITNMDRNSDNQVDRAELVDWFKQSREKIRAPYT